VLELGDHFRSVDGRRQSDWERLQRQFAHKRNEQERREKLEDRMEDNATAFAAGMAVATDIQIQDFEAKLDRYEAATVAALIENQERLDTVTAQMFVLLDQAYVLEDGRRVFKAEDGTQVFDEFGEEVGADEIDPDLIGGDYPTWESYQPLLAEKQALDTEREQLLDYQERLDDARDRIADGDLTEAELDELDAELADLAPPAVRAQVPDSDASTDTPDRTAAEPVQHASPKLNAAQGSSPTPPT